MKKTLIAFATLSALAGMAQAQSSVSIYGLVDGAVRHTTNQSTAGDGQTTVGNGLIHGSRIGFKGQEDLGNGTKALFQLESGFDVGNGTAQQNGGTFSRTATVGLSNDTYGTLTVGRQNNLAYDALMASDVYGVSDTVAIGGYQSTLSGFRWDNSVKYTNKMNGFNYGAQYASGNTVGTGDNSAYALGLGYKADRWSVQTAYQKARDTNDGTLGSFAGEDQSFWTVGGQYALSNDTNLFGQYAHSKFDQSTQTNEIVTLGVAQKLGGNWAVKGAATWDKQQHVAAGTRQTYSAVLDYTLSSRTGVYTGVDYNKLGSGYSNTAYTLNSPVNTQRNSTGVTLGLRHSF